jgi:cytochrome c oxidase subunit I
MPVFTWNILLTSVMVLIAFPVLAAALMVLEIDRKLGSQVFTAGSMGVRELTGVGDVVPAAAA